MNKVDTAFKNIILFSKWFQLPLYLGLIVGGCLYTYRYIIELIHLATTINVITENELMMGVLLLVDIVMVANLLVMVIIGGYSTFVSKINMGNDKDMPDWLDSISAGTLKIKMSTALVGISGIHLLQTFINIQGADTTKVMLQIAVHMTFVVSALLLTFVEYVMHKSH